MKPLFLTLKWEFNKIKNKDKREKLKAFFLGKK